MASYDTYNWDSDEKWKEYLQNVTVPASGNENEMMEKLRKRYFKKNINSAFDDTPSQQQSSPPPQNPPPPQRPQTQTQPQAQSQSQPLPQQPQSQQLFSLDNIWTISHIYLIVNAILFLIPFTSIEFSHGCYRRTLFSGCVAYGISLYRTFAGGPYRGNARVKDFVYYLLFCAAVLTTSSPSMIFVIPLAICSFFMVGETVIQLTGRVPILSILGRLLRKPLSYQAQAQFGVAYAELLAFVMSVFQFLTGSVSLIVVLTLWQFVTYRYQTSAPSKQMVDMYMEKVNGLFLHRFVPGPVKAFYTNVRNFFSNYAQFR